MNTEHSVEQRSLGRQYLYDLYSREEGYQKLSNYISKFNYQMKTYSKVAEEHLTSQNTTYDYETHAFRKSSKNTFKAISERELIKCSCDHLIYRLSDLAKNLFPDSKDKQIAVEEYLKYKIQKQPNSIATAVDFWEFCQIYKNNLMLFEKIREKKFRSSEEKENKLAAHQLYLKSDQYQIDILDEQLEELNSQTVELHKDLQIVFKREILFVRNQGEFQLLIDIVKKQVVSKENEALKSQLLKTLEMLLKCNVKQEFIEVNLDVLFDPNIFQCVSPNHKDLFTTLTSFSKEYVEIHQELETSRAELVRSREKLELLIQKRDANKEPIEKASN